MRIHANFGGIAWVLLCLLSPQGLAGEPLAPSTNNNSYLPPNEAVTLGINLDSGVLQARAAALTAEGRLTQNRLLSYNPQVDVAYAIAGSRTSLGLSQSFSPLGVAALERQAAQAQLDSAQAQLERSELLAAATIRLTYSAAVVAIGQRNVAEQAVAIADRLSEAAEAKLNVGEASQLDLRLAHLSQAQAATWLLQAQAQESNALRTLSAMIQQPVTLKQLSPDPLSVAPWSTEGQELLGSRSDVRAAQGKVDAAQAQVKVAKARALPPITIGGFLEQEEGLTFVGPTVSIPLPIFNRNQQAQGTALGAAKVAETRAGAVQALANAEIETARTRVNSAQSALESIEIDLIKEAKEALNSITLGYDAGELDLSTALLLQRQVLEGESAAITLRGQVAAARIDWALSNEFDALRGVTEQ